MLSPEVIYCILFIFPAAMTFAAAMDFFTMTIPNRVSLVLIAGFLVGSLAVALPLETFATHLIVGVCVLLVGMALFFANVLGGGDAKLLAAASLWFGTDQLLPFLLYVGLLGGALCLAIMTFRRQVLPLWATRQDWVVRLHKPYGGVPYGVAIGGAALLVFPASSWFAAVVGG